MTLFDSCMLKTQALIQLFSHYPTIESKYQKIIEMGRNLPPYPPSLKTEDRLVKGCQSQMYLDASFNEGKMHFLCYSEALISAGLAALLLEVYQDEPPEAILSYPPLFLEKIGIHTALSPGRSNGLNSLFLRMKQLALNYLVK